MTKGKLPQTDFLRLSVNQSFFKQGEDENTNGDEYNLNFDNVKVLADILNDPNMFELREKIVEIIRPGRYEYLMRACGLMVNKELVFTG